MAKRSFKQFEQDMQEIVEDFEQLRKDLPDIAGAEAEEFFKLNFEKEGFIEGGTLNKWESRIPGTPRNDRKILSDTNTLEKSIRYRVSGEEEVSVGVDLDKVPYARIHNEGGYITVTPAMKRFFWAKFKETGDKFWKRLALTQKSRFEIPKRQYMGFTPDLDKRIKRAIDYRIDDIMNSK